MPELPEVETMCRGIRGVIGHRVKDIQRGACRLKPILVEPRIDAARRRLVGRTIAGIERLGKRVGVRFDDQQILYIEPRMTGLVLLSDPPSCEHVRLVMDLEGGPITSLCFWDRRGLGTVRLYTAAEAVEKLGPDRLGPDALQIDPVTMRSRLSQSRRPIKVVLLDQQRITGIGNLYASEILFVAEIDPRTPAHRLTAAQWCRLHQATGAVLEEAIRYEGSTLGDGTYRNALNQVGSYQNHHRVYDRAKQPCARCQSGIIQRIVQAQRSTFFCNQCQRRSKR